MAQKNLSSLEKWRLGTSKMSNQEKFNDALKSMDRIHWPDDCERIRQVGIRMGIDMDLRQAQTVWQEYSEACCAGWLSLGVDAGIKEAIKKFVKYHTNEELDAMSS